MHDLVAADLVGPAHDGGEEEELPSVMRTRPRERYLCGMLAPARTPGMASDEARLAVATKAPDEGADEAENVSEHMFSSSIGVSFTVAADAAAVDIEARWGRYERGPSAREVTEKTGQPRTVWKRKPMRGSRSLALVEGDAPRVAMADDPAVFLDARVRRRPEGWIITVFLVNRHDPAQAKSDSAWLFQPELRVSGPDNAAIFERHGANGRATFAEAEREEREHHAMIYRDDVQFATGHGVAVHATPAPGTPARATVIVTRVMPFFDVPQVEAPRADENRDLRGLLLDMKELAECAPTEVVIALRVLATAYEKWISKRTDEVAANAHGLAAHGAAAERALTACRRAHARIAAGVELLATNTTAMEAFQFANRAMWQQRLHTLIARATRKGRLAESLTFDDPKYRSWRPFQLAFILLNLPGITDLHHPERSHPTDAAADLLWFPTGGGKTEAYLGLTGYTLALRRLQGPIAGHSGEHGLAVLMRYTLRLLTLQQFQRAATLLCACEFIRKGDEKKWGRTPFRIGLWVGRKTTPNTTAQAAEAIQELIDSNFTTHGSPAQLTTCPWCGTRILPGRDIVVYRRPGDIGRTVLYCGDERGFCPFSRRHADREGLPVLVVDEEIYRRPPSVLVATVDKFAQMPWRGEVQMLFGRVTGECPRHGFLSPQVDDASRHNATPPHPASQNQPHPLLRPPDLIIQDELHLISGPLGSMVGLYETAVDELCSWTVDGKRVRPKVVASTATIRRAAEQVRQLFVRQVEVFPPPGVHADDNFFAVKRAPEVLPGRRYVGVCAFGRRFPEALIRLKVAVMAAAQKLYVKYDYAADPWMTLVGYFNSIRELGGARRVVDDDIRARLFRADERGLARRSLRRVEELTSRQRSDRIPEILDRLDIRFAAADEAARKALQEANKKVEPPLPYDVILATNMISVGVDVDRLGLMVVAGQPKTTAEYIQATSRVGRQSPGLVFMLFNWARPRDLSHYETFEHYHATFYQHVEALSITPFAPRALDRGLSAVMTALIRQPEARLNANESAAALADHDPLLVAAMETLAARAENTTQRKDRRKETLDAVEERRQHWLKKARAGGGARLGYVEQSDKNNECVGLLSSPGQLGWSLFTCLHSLRDVEPTVHLLLSEAPLDSAAPQPPPPPAP
ncbi:MAG: DISARM system helicase DrmA [Chthoniobacteraceae bacterium]